MDLLTPPSWASSWCYVYFAGALLVAAGAFLALIMGYKKMTAFPIIMLILSGTLAFIDAMMYFWICRAALAK